jgi:hypothetical protein
LVRDKVWFWGSFGSNDIKNRTGGATPDAVQADDTILENTAFKVNAQFSPSNSATGSWNNGDKNKFGRNASPTRPAPSTWNQRGPSAVIKVEDTHVVNSNFFIGGTLSKVDGGFQLNCQACLNGLAGATETQWDENGVWQNSFLSGPSSRPSEEIKIDGSYFFNTGNVSHEIKFGARQRQFETESAFHWPGRDIFVVDLGLFGVSGNTEWAVAHRGETPLTSQEYTSFWAQDTFSSGNLTANFGFRYDLQEGANEPFSIPANPGFPNDLPAVDFAGSPGAFDWETITPRFGITYAVGEDKDILLRASFAQFAEQLSSGNINRVNPLGDVYGYYYMIDANNNGFYDPGELDTSTSNVSCNGVPIPGLDYASGYDPCDPNGLSDPDVTDPNLDPSVTNELILGAEWALMPEFVVGFQATIRETDDVLGTREMIVDANGVERPAVASDYRPEEISVSGDVPGVANTAVIWGLNDGVSRTGGNYLENTDRSIDYTGFNINFIKRLSNRWMLRGYYNYGDAEWNVGGGYTANNDPTRGISGQRNGDLYVVQAAGSGAKANVFLQSTWQFNVNGMYQVAPDKPWGFNVAGNIFSREGTPLPYFTNPRAADGQRISVRLTDAVDSIRTPDITTVDLRLEKEFAGTGNVGFTFSLDAFNLFDDTTVLQRERNMRLSSRDYLRETLSPKIYRLGVRMNFR